MAATNSFFTTALLQWHSTENVRSMPWKGIKDPYRIWLSEIILQQTRVEQGLPYYEKFIEAYPTVHALAAAKDEAVFKLWEGLGYYNRCRNLLFTARYIATQGGNFPNNYNDLLALKGVGPYTAAAIASFAFNLPYAVIDGNVYRVLARFSGNDTPTDSTEGQLLFKALAQQMLATDTPAEYNQAIMDFGATVCTPLQPKCGSCPLQQNCVAYATGTVHHLPVKAKTLVKKNRWLTYFVIEHNGKWLIHQRAGSDIWQQLHEFYLVETGEKQVFNTQAATKWWNEQWPNTLLRIKHVSRPLKQQLTHQTIHAQFVALQLITIPASLQHYEYLTVNEIKQLAFPKIINQYLNAAPLT
ncbi:MAG TPA: A/G-specific adenine glycosylase [Chitinophagaceae bacterium]|nr:A/G-specific adenine glycosylase [Chitinophagaceae bacterium]HAN39268.1 A/G-specific adenine glycosylase [Chitinophagaceae bacterium]